MNNENQFGLFTEEEMKLKELIRKNRFSVIEHLTKDGPPADNSTIRILNEVMTAADNEIVETAKLRHAVKAQKDDSNMKQIMLNILSGTETPPMIGGSDKELIEVDVMDSAVTEGGELFIENYLGDNDENDNDNI